jgi:hypothetical protein
MTVKVTERDDSHMDHESVAACVRIWDVHQQDMLVGMFHSESDAYSYKAKLETLEQQREARSA